MPPSDPLHVLILEDNTLDAELMVRALKQAGFDVHWRHVDSEPAYLAALHPGLDVILADYSLPAFGALRALQLVKERQLDVPFIVVSGSIGEDMAVNLLHHGAADYLLKDRLGRLGQAIRKVRDNRALVRSNHQAEASLRRLEERTRFALQAARVGTWEVNLVTGDHQWSETFEAMHGLAPGEFDGTHEGFLLAVHPDDRGRMQSALDFRRGEWNLSYRTAWPDGSIHWINHIGRTFADDTGVPTRAAGVGLDVTEQRLLEEQYRQSQKMEAVGQLAGGVAHDFNNLLTAIHGYCDLLDDALGSAHPRQRDVAEIRRAAERATSLTRQLLAFGRRQLLDMQVLDLRESVLQMEPMLRRLIGEHIKIDVRFANRLGRVRADAGQIEQVILNLTLNARDAMPDGGTLLIEVKDVERVDEAVSDRAGPPPGRYVAIVVSDTGIGMSTEMRARAFEPFFTTKEKGHGTGLGLSTVYGIVRQSQGTICVDSEPGRGATFSVYLPRVDEIADAPKPAPEVGTLKGDETILVVEDEEGVRELIQKILQRQGYRVLSARDGSEAMEVLSNAGQVDLLISDMVLPQTSGTALAQRIRASRSSIRVLFISGYIAQLEKHGGGVPPGMPFLQKPFTPQGLARKVREVLA